MGLADALERATTKKGPACAMQTVFALLAPGEAAVLRAAFTDPTINAAQIRRALGEEGHHIGVGTVQRHKRGECACGAI